MNVKVSIPTLLMPVIVALVPEFDVRTHLVSMVRSLVEPSLNYTKDVTSSRYRSIAASTCHVLTSFPIGA